MAIEPLPTRRAVSFAVQMIFLSAIAAVLLGFFVVTMNDAADAEDAQSRRLMVRLAWTSFALLCLTLVALVWAIARRMSYRLRRPDRHEPTPYIDAWSEAGRRAKAEDEDTDKDQQQ